MDFTNIGNIEFINLFLTLLAVINPKFKKEFFFLFYEKSINELLEKSDIDTLYNMFLKEAKTRGLKSDKIFTIEGNNIKYSEEFWDFKMHMDINPTFLRECSATNYLGDRTLDDFFDYVMLDFPVREACKVLNEKGYKTYWSSANRDDIKYRKSDVIEGKKVGYILVDPSNLTDELKEKLLLNGKCDFWGVALSYSDNGSYYGIYSELISEDMPCSVVSDDLISKAKALPVLESVHKM